jgi:hypothetical protein
MMAREFDDDLFFWIFCFQLKLILANRAILLEGWGWDTMPQGHR